MIGFMWQCCECGAQWEHGPTTPACLNCGHYMGSDQSVWGQVMSELWNSTQTTTRNPAKRTQMSEHATLDLGGTLDELSETKHEDVRGSDMSSLSVLSPKVALKARDPSKASFEAADTRGGAPSAGNGLLGQRLSSLVPFRSAVTSLSPASASSAQPETVTTYLRQTEFTSQTSLRDPSSLGDDRVRSGAMFSGPKGSRLRSTQRSAPTPDDQASVSQSSTVYTPEQLEDVVSRFSSAVLRNLPFQTGHDSNDEAVLQYLFADLRAALKTFCETKAVHPPRGADARSFRMVKRFRAQIARQIYKDSIGTSDSSEEAQPEQAVGLSPRQGMDYAEKIKLLWCSGDAPSLPAHPIDAQGNMPPRPASQPSALATSVSTNQTDESLQLHDPRRDSGTLSGQNLHASAILKALTNDDVFKELTTQTGRVLERYSHQKLDVIRRRTALTLRRNQPPTHLDNDDYRVSFHVDWDFPGFLDRNYDGAVDPYIKNIAAVTGTPNIAILCSIGEYFALQWPTLPTALLDAITFFISGQRKQSSRWYSMSTISYFPCTSQIPQN